MEQVVMNEEGRAAMEMYERGQQVQVLKRGSLIGLKFKKMHKIKLKYKKYKTNLNNMSKRYKTQKLGCFREFLIIWGFLGL